MTIKEKFDAFVKEHGTPPRYADVSVCFENDKEYIIPGYTIAMVHDEETERLDDYIFFYCDSLKTLISLTDWSGEDFKVIEDSVVFTNVI